MTELCLRGVWSDALKNLSVSFEVGLHVILGRVQDGISELIELCAGLRAPRRGWLSLDGTPPSSDPGARRWIASLLPNEAQSSRERVRDFAARVGTFRGFDAAPALARFAPDLDPSRPLDSLAGAEPRRLALALALGQTDSRLVLLHMPLGVLEPGLSSLLEEQIAELARSRVVLVTAASVADARRLGGSLGILERGVLARSAPDAWPRAMTPGLEVSLWIECDAPRELLRALAGESSISALGYEEGAGTPRLRLRGHDLEALALAVTRAAVAARVNVRVLTSDAPDLEVVHGASAGLAHAAYRAAQNQRTLAS